MTPEMGTYTSTSPRGGGGDCHSARARIVGEVTRPDDGGRESLPCLNVVVRSTFGAQVRHKCGRARRRADRRPAGMGLSRSGSTATWRGDAMAPESSYRFRTAG